VVLEGEVADVAAKKRALEAAASVEGVDGIVDRLRAWSSPAAWARSKLPCATA
jgi:predicted nucleic acid-binding Zn ribbon protein